MSPPPELVRLSLESREIEGMFARIQWNATNENPNGWRWNLLSVLDWNRYEIEQNTRWIEEVEFRRYRFEVANEPIEQVRPNQRPDHATWPELLRDVTDRRKRIERARKAFEKAKDVFEWVCDPVSAKNIAHALMNATLAVESKERNLAEAVKSAGMRGKAPRYDHVRAAALLVLADLEGFDERTLAAQVGTLIEQQNRRANPPCPAFAKSHTSEKAPRERVLQNIRQILTRARLEG